MCGCHLWKTCASLVIPSLTPCSYLSSSLEPSDTLGVVMLLFLFCFFLRNSWFARNCSDLSPQTTFSSPSAFSKAQVWLTAHLSLSHYVSIISCKTLYPSRWPSQYLSSPSSSMSSFQWLCPLFSSLSQATVPPVSRSLLIHSDSYLSNSSHLVST